MDKEMLIPKEPIIETDQQLQLLYRMMLIRRFEERAAEEYTKSNIRGFLHLYIGEEAVATGVISALTAEDIILSTYREHGHALARGVDAGAIMAEMFGMQEGCSRGRGGSMHLFDKKNNFYGGNAIVAGHLPVAVGMALALKKQKKNAVVCCFFGEGAVAEGEFHEAMNLAALLHVPLLFVCENNLYAMGTAIRYSHAMTDIEKKGIAYGMTSSTVDGMDVMAVQNATRNAIEQIRKTSSPYFLVCNTYRFRAHSMFDAELYREKKEVEEWKKKDPIVLLTTHLVNENKISPEKIAEFKQRADEQVENAVAFAASGTREPVEQLTRFTYSEINNLK
ncbi:MAG TPA: pyruvate dehydrogenase (acetyl-transferring) E1 component subunit alpha [Bacteroidia bacterium]|jgi:pyruvate dehydrogenase E1 component alpha subunit|nr:pyruvate dehydrogenase (acetyl-transferring) E1 component subunit alpha [Bacteroidia bacterium]